MDFFIKAAQLVTSLSILIVLHELGHFIPAKLFKTRVEKFYLFFDPWFSLFKIKRGDTQYGIGWLPLGGYVKISGMIDESMDKEAMGKPPQPWEFRSKPTWQRLIIMLGGVTMNVILALVIYIMVLFIWGREYLPLENVKYGVYCDSLFHQYGLQDGDIIVAVEGEKPKSFTTISKEILIRDAREITVDRNGQIKTIHLPADIDEQLLDQGVRSPFMVRIPFVIDSVLPGKPAELAGLHIGDSLVQVNDVATPFGLEFNRAIKQYKNEQTTVGFYRGGELLTVAITPDKDGIIGIGNKGLEDYLTLENEEYTFLQSIPAGIKFGLTTLSDYVVSLKLLFSSAGAKQLGGFGTIGGLFGPTWEWHTFWMMTALISIILAFMNILPIPALDGGHVMFLLYEMLFRRKPSDKFMEYAQIAGMVILFTLVIYANGNDIVRAFAD